MSKFKVKMAITITIITYMALLIVQRPNVMTCHDFTVWSSIEKCRQALGIGSLSFEQLSCKLGKPELLTLWCIMSVWPTCHTRNAYQTTFHRVSMSFLVSWNFLAATCCHTIGTFTKAHLQREIQCKQGRWVLMLCHRCTSHWLGSPVTRLKVARETASFLCLQRLLPILIGLLTAAAAVVVLSSVTFNAAWFWTCAGLS